MANRAPVHAAFQSIPVALIMLLWTAFSIIMVMFPSTTKPTAQEMNYAVVVSGAWILLCIVYYYFPVYGGVHWFTGPVANIEIDTPVKEVRIDTESKEEKQ